MLLGQDSPRYLPRKGTETLWENQMLHHIQCCNSPRYLPRKGTETVAGVVTETIVSAEFATIFTPQGDGNSFWAAVILEPTWPIRHDIYPARGRKLRCSVSIHDKFRDIRHDIYPARGRKPMYAKSSRSNSLYSFATIFTPQGDGNWSQW